LLDCGCLIMRYEQLIALKDQDLGYEVREIEESSGVLRINDYYILPVYGVRSYYDIQQNISINDENGNEIGVLCCCKARNIELTAMTEWEFYAFLSEAPDYLSEYLFMHSYLLVKKERYPEYLNDFFESAPIWGGFYHQNLSLEPNKRSITEIKAVRGIKLPTSYHIENSIRAIKQPYAFECFLKSYHLLELLFDYSTVQEINSLGADLAGIGKILANYGRSEYDRLKTVVYPKCTNPGPIIHRLNEINYYKTEAKKIFWDFGKESNPIKNEDSFDAYINSGDFSESKYRFVNGISSTKVIVQDHKQFIINVATYFIYRVRSSIAHSRIGEYVMQHNDERFVIDFAIPLLDEILYQVFQI